MNPPEIYPLTPDRWQDLETLFGPRGACAGCWCMFWKLRGKAFDLGKGAGNRLSQHEYVAAGNMPGLLAYVDGVPAGWAAVEPRQRYPVLEHSRILAPLDDQPVWSVPCFFIARGYRGQGLTVALLRAALKHVAAQGGRIVEGYPVEPAPSEKGVPTFVYTGLASAFRQAGFVEAARRSEKRPIMRFVIEG